MARQLKDTHFVNLLIAKDKNKQKIKKVDKAEMNLCSFKTFCSKKVFTIIHLSPHVREESKTVVNSGFHAVDSGALKALDQSGFFVSGIWIPNSDC